MKKWKWLSVALGVVVAAAFMMGAPSFAADKSRFASIDGKATATSAQDAGVKAVFVTKDKAGKEQQLGFTSRQKLMQHLAKNNSGDVTIQGSGICCTDMYQGSNKTGSYIAVKLGTGINDMNLSNPGWDNTVSSLSVADKGYTLLTQLSNFYGETIVFDNEYFWGKTINLSNYYLSNEVDTWNNRTTSVDVFMP